MAIEEDETDLCKYYSENVGECLEIGFQPSHNTSAIWFSHANGVHMAFCSGAITEQGDHIE